jgi:hypothetical protein
MKDLERMLDLLEQKKAFFLHYQKEMEAMPFLPAEELEPCVQRGALIIQKIEELDGKLNQLIQQNGPLARMAVNHACDRGQLAPDLGKLYDASLNVKAVANGILKNDGLIRERLAYEREKALEDIKGINSRASSVASRYQQSAQTGVSGPLRGRQGRDV